MDLSRGDWQGGALPLFAAKKKASRHRDTSHTRRPDEVFFCFRCFHKEIFFTKKTLAMSNKPPHVLPAEQYRSYPRGMGMPPLSRCSPAVRTACPGDMAHEREKVRLSQMSDTRNKIDVPMR